MGCERGREVGAGVGCEKRCPMERREGVSVGREALCMTRAGDG